MLDDRKSRIRFVHSYEDIISVENLLLAWREFLPGKRHRPDVQEFQYRLMDNLLELHDELASGTYTHGSYHAFKIADPKPRDIHKATVRDRLLHHALYRKLYPFFECTWISDSYSCRDNKGTHRAMNRFRSYAAMESRNHTRTVWVLKCDIRKFFASIDHSVLLGILRLYIIDVRVLGLLENVVDSFYSSQVGIGLPLGNLTSQLLVNIYMNELDQYMKHSLKARKYVRYADDFVILSSNKAWLLEILPKIADFLNNRLRLEMHPDKVYIQTYASGVDFLGWVHFIDHRIPRTSTVRRMIRNLSENRREQSVLSYRGMLSHGNARGLTEKHLRYP